MRAILGNCLKAMVALLGAVTVVFIIVRVVSGDPAELMLGSGATDEQIKQVRHDLELDQPIWRQYLTFLAGLLRGDLGHSWRLGGDALTHVLERVPATLVLAGGALLVTIVLGFPIGIYCAQRVGSLGDRMLATMSVVGQGLPTFWVGVVLILIFSRRLGILPSTPDGTLRSMILPAVTLALPFLGWLAKLVRNGAVEELDREHVQTAQAKGLGRRRIFYIHVMRNTLVPVVTVLGLLIGNFIANAVIVETVFTWPGIGSLLIDAIVNRDYAVVQGAVLVITAGYVITSTAIDSVYVYLDPRVGV